MPETQFQCPSCGVSIKSAQPIASGQRVRCGGCGAVFRAGERTDPEMALTPVQASQPRRQIEEDDAPPRRPRKTPTPEITRGWSLPLVLALGGGVLLLGCAGVGLALLLWMAKDDARPITPVTAADLDKVQIYMTRAEVEAALGKGRPASTAEMQPDWVVAGQRSQATNWSQWGGGNDTLYVGFGQGKSGTQRAVISFFVHKTTRGNVAVEETKPGIMNLNLLGEDLDVLAKDKGKENALLKDPKWKKGAEVRKALVGFWVAIGVGGYDFKEDGTVRSESGLDKLAGTYRFTDDEHIEMSLKPAAGGGGAAQKLRCKVLVAEKELILIDDRFPDAHPVVYERRG